MRLISRVIVLCGSLLAGLPPAKAVEEPAGELLCRVTEASRAERSLEAEIRLTWKTGGAVKSSSGTFRLRRPNLAEIRLSGDYPLRELVSDGVSRFAVEDPTVFTRSAMDARGEMVDAPWWGLPFRFFFTQSLNPFGAKPDASARLTRLADETVAGVELQGLQAEGTSPMGAYTGRFFFDKEGVLWRSSVIFGSGPGAAVFEAALSHVRVNGVGRTDAFRFVPAAGQSEKTTADGMLAAGERAPEFSLRAPGGKRITLADERRGKKATLVNFWYYNCAPCRVEFPEFEKLYQRYRSQGFTIVAIDKGDPEETVSEYGRRTGLSFPLVLGGSLRKGSVFERYGVTEQFPGTYLLDGDGKIVYRSTGEDLPGLKQELAKLGFR